MTGIMDTSGKFAAGMDDKTHKKLLAKFATGVISTGGKFATGVANTVDEFSKKFETALMLYSGAWGKLIYEKNHLVILSL
jgi:hypothetical protein